MIGQGTPRASGRRLLAGRGRYTDDLRFARLAHAAFLRSPHAHARILRLDLAPAQSAPGVLAVYDAATLARVCRPWQTRLATWPQHHSAAQPPLASDRAVYQGQPVAIVIAATRAQAEDAVACIVIEWEACDPIADPRAALAAGAILIHAGLASNLALEHQITAGEDVFANDGRAHTVVRQHLRFTRHTGVPLEARSIVAEFDATMRRLTVHQATQVPHQMRAVLADHLGLAEHDVRVLAPDVGGGFGIKLHVYDDEMAVCAAAMLVNRPIKFVCDRLEAFASDIHARGHEVDAAIALSEDGNILGFAIDTLAEAGAYSVFPRSSVLEGLQVIGFAGIPYAGNAYRAKLRVVYQNKIGTASYRGVGQPVGTGIVESLVDAGARALGLDPAELRRRNYRSAPNGGTKTPAGVEAGELSHTACLDRLLALMDYPALRVRQRAARAEGRYLGIGLASFVEQNAPGPAFYGAANVKISAQDGCILRLEPSGTVTCITSNVDQGQGVETALAQLVAAGLDLPLAAVRVLAGDTLATPVGGGVFASRGLVISGEAALAACAVLRERIIAVATALEPSLAPLTQLNPELVRHVATIINYKPHLLPSSAASLADPIVSANVTMSAPFLLANGTQASLVEVDPDTGFVKLMQHWIVEDCGRVVNPLLADEQLRGGIVQGIGAALWEECRYDDHGNLLTGTMADYLVPMAGELPDIVVAHVETPLAGTRLGSKGVGEAGTIGAAIAVGNAINDALAPFGAVLTDQPYTPERVLRALGKTT